MSGPSKPPSSFKILNNGFGLQPIGPSPLGGDVHDTFRVDKEGNITKGHTTIRIPGGKEIRLDWDRK